MDNNSWSGKMCPELTKASFMAKELARKRDQGPRVVSASLDQPASNPEPEAISCQGPVCQWFISRADEKGNVLGGDCATVLAPLASNQQAMAINELVKLISAAISKFAHIGAAVETSKS